MCVAIRFTSTDGSAYFARNLDTSNPMGVRPLAVPAGYRANWTYLGTAATRHTVIGSGYPGDRMPGFLDACNSAGLAVGVLALPKSTHYAPAPVEGRRCISRYELPFWLAATFGSVAEVEQALADAVLVSPDVPGASGVKPFPMHWFVADASDSLVIEADEGGIELYHDNVEVLTNEPSFPDQRERLQAYLHERGNDEHAVLHDLPGDCSSTSRFIKTAVLNARYPAQETEHGNVIRAFRTLNAVAVPLGAARASDGGWKTTVYQCAFSAKTNTYYRSTYDDPAIRSWRLDEIEFMAGTEPVLL